jgi:hypothetical protein
MLAVKLSPMLSYFGSMYKVLNAQNMESGMNSFSVALEGYQLIHGC